MKRKLVLIFEEGDKPPYIENHSFVFDNDKDAQSYFESTKHFTSFEINESYFSYTVKSWGNAKYFGKIYWAYYI